MRTQAVEDYLKAIYKLQREQDRVATTVLAVRLGVAPASVTGMIKKLAAMNLITYEPYRGVELTETGQKLALEVIRHHRLVELYLAEALEVPWDRVHDEAEKWEHILSEDLEERIDSLLGYPTTDPHGAPIPSRSGVIQRPVSTLLSDLQPGESAVIVEVDDHDPEMLRYMGDLGLYPGAVVDVITVAPFDGPLTVVVDGVENIVGQEVASNVFVRAVSQEASIDTGVTN